MNKSDLEKMQKCQEEYEKYLKESPLHSVIDEIAKDIRDRQDNIMAMEFTRTISELLRENGIVVHCTENSCIRDVSDKKIEEVYGVMFDRVDCTKHDRKFTDRIAELEKECAEKQKQIGDLEKRLEIFSKVNCFVKLDVFKDPVQAYINSEVSVKEAEIKNLQDKISELEAELSVKEKMIKTRNGLYGEKYLCDLTPVEVASTLINAEWEYETNSIERAFGAGEKEKYNIFSVSELRQIAEHLLVYCNHNLEDNSL